MDTMIEFSEEQFNEIMEYLNNSSCETVQDAIIEAIRNK